MKTLYFLIATLCATSTQASCIPAPDKTITVTIEKILAPLQKENIPNKDEISPIDGCLIFADGQQLGQADQENLCQMSPGTTVNLFITQEACCDHFPTTNPRCGIIFKPEDGSETIYGKSTSVYLAE